MQLLDLELDPLTRDLIDQVDGAVVEADDSRTVVIFQLTERRDEGCLGETTGSRIGALLEREEPATTAELRDAALEAMQLLVDAGVIADLTVTVGEPPATSPTLALVILDYTDTASGRRVSGLVVPFGGVTP